MELVWNLVSCCYCDRSLSHRHHLSLVLLSVRCGVCSALFERLLLTDKQKKTVSWSICRRWWLFFLNRNRPSKIGHGDFFCRCLSVSLFIYKVRWHRLSLVFSNFLQYSFTQWFCRCSCIRCWWNDCAIWSMLKPIK